MGNRHSTEHVHHYHGITQAQHQQALDQQKQQHEATMNDTKLSDLLKDEKQHKTLKEELISKKQIKLSQIENKYNDFLIITQDYNILTQKVAIESELIVEFVHERNDPNCKLIIAIGDTGVGKSTFGNRMLDDDSADGDEGDFEVGHTVNAMTCKISKKMIRKDGLLYSIVDTPGAFDTHGRDMQFTNNLVNYLRGCGGVNTFALFFKATDRFNINYQQLFKKYQQLFGKDFWNYTIMIMTWVDTIRMERANANANQLRARIMEEMNLTGGNEFLPIILLGHNNYKPSLNNLCSIISSNKYNCESITSPIDTLIEHEKNLKNKRENMKNDITNILTDANNIDDKITSINKELNENDENIRQLQEKLNKDIRPQIIYEGGTGLPVHLSNISLENTNNININQSNINSNLVRNNIINGYDNINNPNTYDNPWNIDDIKQEEQFGVMNDFGNNTNNIIINDENDEELQLTENNNDFNNLENTERIIQSNGATLYNDNEPIKQLTKEEHVLTDAELAYQLQMEDLIE